MQIYAKCSSLCTVWSSTTTLPGLSCFDQSMVLSGLGQLHPACVPDSSWHSKETSFSVALNWLTEQKGQFWEVKPSVSLLKTPPPHTHTQQPPPKTPKNNQFTLLFVHSPTLFGEVYIFKNCKEETVAPQMLRMGAKQLPKMAEVQPFFFLRYALLSGCRDGGKQTIKKRHDYKELGFSSCLELWTNYYKLLSYFMCYFFFINFNYTG